MTRAALIDLDGTLVDTLPDIHAAIAMMCATFALPAPAIEAVRGWIGKGSLKLVEAVFRDAGATVSPALGLDGYMTAYAEVNGRFAKVFPGVVEGLAALAERGIATACVTNKPHRFADDLLVKMGLRERFSVVLGGDQGVALKPAADLLLAAATRLCATIRDCVMVGDSENDLAAARAAGCPCVLVSYGYSPLVPVQALGADAIVDALGEACSWMVATPVTK